jgi:hypothetical protein
VEINQIFRIEFCEQQILKILKIQIMQTFQTLGARRNHGKLNRDMPLRWMHTKFEQNRTQHELYRSIDRTVHTMK